MAVKLSDGKRASSVDADAISLHERFVGYEDGDSIDGGHDAAAAEEDARFLPLGDDVGPEPVLGPSKPTRRYVMLMSVLFLFIVEVSQFVMEPPLQAIMEDFICHAHYQDFTPGAKPQDSRCKESRVQSDLAMTRSWMMFVSMLVPLLVQIPYGVLADKWGRRPVLFLGLLGLVLMTVCNFVVLLYPDVFSTWHLIWGSIPTIIGGGVPAITAMVWTILTDTIPVEERTELFYKLNAMMLILSAVCYPIAAWLLSINPWLPMWIGMFALILSMFSTLFIPETLHFNPTAQIRFGDGQDGFHQVKHNDMKSAWTAAQKSLSHIANSIFKSKDLLLLLGSYALCYPLFIAFGMNILQYTTARYNWEWSTATYVTTVSKVTSVVVLLVILPLCSYFVTQRFGFEALARDLFLARGSVIFLAAGTIITAIAAAPPLLVTSLIVYSFGSGFYPQIRALLAAMVEADMVATLNTFISTLETIMSLVSVPLLGWFMSKGIEMGGVWMGLPFLVASICSAAATVAIFAFRIPLSTRNVESLYH